MVKTFLRKKVPELATLILFQLSFVFDGVVGRLYHSCSHGQCLDKGFYGFMGTWGWLIGLVSVIILVLCFGCILFVRFKDGRTRFAKTDTVQAENRPVVWNQAEIDAAIATAIVEGKKEEDQMGFKSTQQRRKSSAITGINSDTGLPFLVSLEGQNGKPPSYDNSVG